MDRPGIAVQELEGRTTLIDVLANDSDPNGDALSISRIVAKPSNGQASIIDGKVSYAPDPGFVGSDSFTYEVSDGKGGKIGRFNFILA